MNMARDDHEKGAGMAQREGTMSNHPLMKALNRAKVLNALRLRHPLSRSDIADLVGLDRKSITNFSVELLEDGLVREVGKQARPRGRPLTLLDFRPEASQVVGIGIAAESVTGVRVDFHGRVHALRETPLAVDPTLRAVVRAVRETYTELKGHAGARRNGAGLSIPGVLDLEAGVVKESVNLPCLKGVNFREAFSAAIPERLFVEEASQAKALAEKWFGLGREQRDFVCVDLGVGVGAGIVMDRKLYRGAGGHGGELGHVIVEYGGRRCRCGNRGCLEAYVSQRTILKEIRRVGGPPARRFEEIGEVSPQVEQVLASVGRWLGRGLAPLVNIINPTVILLNGGLMRFERIVLPSVWGGLRECSLPACLQGTKVLASTTEHSTALGAATSVLSSIFEVEGHLRA
jgi:predicted NBD/HSP70 family sugar kinase